MKTFKQFSEGLLGTKGDGYLGPKFLGIKNPVAAGRESIKNAQINARKKKLDAVGDSPETREMLGIPLDYKFK